MGRSSLATAYVQIIPTADGISNRLREELGDSAEAGGTEAGGKFGKGLLSSAISAMRPVAEAIKMTMDVGAELQQNLGGSEAVFGDFASSIQKSATEAYKKMGMSASDYMATANKMGSLFQGSGIEQQRSLELTTNAMQRAADMASVMGINTQMAMDSVAGAAKGNFTMMDNLGVAMNATTLQAYALEKGINFNWNTASNAEKAELAMEMFMDKTSQYANNYAEEAEHTFSGSFEAMKAAATNVLGNLALGEDIGPSLQALGDTVFTFISGNMIPMLGNILSALPSALEGLGGMIAQGLEMAADGAGDALEFGAKLVGNIVSAVIKAAPKIASAAFKLLAALGEGIANLDFAAIGGNIIDMISSESESSAMESGVEMITNILNGLLEGLPNLITGIGTLVTSMVDYLLTNAPMLMESGFNLITNLITGLVSNFPAIYSSISDMMMNFISMLMSHGPEIVSKGFELVGKLVSGLIQNLPALVEGATELMTKMLAKFIEYLPDLLKMGVDLITELISGLSSMLTDIWNAAKELGDKAVSAFTEIDWLQLGTDIVNGIIKGVQDAASSLWEAMKNLASDALQAAKDALGIESPSKVMRDQVGKHISSGVAVGILKGIPEVRSAIGRMADIASSDFDASMSMTGMVGTSYSGSGRSGGVQVTQNIYSQAQTAADLMQEARWNAEMAVLYGV